MEVGDGPFLLHDAIREGNVEEVGRLVGCMPATRLLAEDKEGNTPLSLCAELDNDCAMAEALLEKVGGSLLLERSAFREESALEAALLAQNQQLVQMMMKKVPLTELGMPYPDGSSHMQAAVASGNVEVVRQLIEAIPNVVAATNKGSPPPIALAVRTCNRELVDLLLAHLHGVEETLFGSATSPRTASLEAVWEGQDEVAIAILSTQGIPDERVTSQLFAVAFGQSDSALLRFLIAHVPPEAFCAPSIGYRDALIEAPIEHYKLLLAAYPDSKHEWLGLGALLHSFPVAKFTQVLEVLQSTAPDVADFAKCLSNFMHWAVMRGFDDLAMAGMAFYDEAVAEHYNGKTPVEVLCCFKMSAKGLLLAFLEHLPERAWVHRPSGSVQVLSDAVRHRRPELLRILFDAFPRELWTAVPAYRYSNALLTACSPRYSHRESLEVVAELWSEEELLCRSSAGDTCLHSCAKYANIFDLELLAAAMSPAALLVEDVAGNTPLHTAAARANTAAVCWLVERMPPGGKNLRNHHGLTALDLLRATPAPSPVALAALEVRPKAALHS